MPHIPGAKFPYEGQPPEGLEPGTFGCNEALQLARSRAPDRNGGRELRLCASLLRRTGAGSITIRHRWRSAQAVRAAKREMRVGASGRWANQAARRSRLRAAAVATVCRPVLASPR